MLILILMIKSEKDNEVNYLVYITKRIYGYSFTATSRQKW